MGYLNLITSIKRMNRTCLKITIYREDIKYKYSISPRISLYGKVLEIKVEGLSSNFHYN